MREEYLHVPERNFFRKFFYYMYKKRPDIHFQFPQYKDSNEGYNKYIVIQIIIHTYQDEVF